MSAASDCLPGQACTLDISRSIFTKNSAGNSGAVAVIADSIDLNISASSFSGNIAQQQSGALSLQRNNGGSTGALSFHAAGTSFANNSAGLAGALYASDSAVRLINCSFYNNTAAADSGGGLYADSLTDLAVDTCVFASNEGARLSYGRQLDGVLLC